MVLAVILMVALPRLRLLEVPLERDEGEYAYMGQLLLEGIPPYSQAYNMKFPGIYFLYALIVSFSQTVTAIHLALLLVNVCSIVLVFFLGRHLFGTRAAVMASASFAVLTVSYHLEGLWANSEHFLLPFALAGILLLLLAGQRRSTTLYGLAGFLLGVAILVKQHGAFFAFFGLAYVAYVAMVSGDRQRPASWKKVTTFLAAVLAPLLLVGLYLYISGVFEKFFFWTFTYASTYIKQVPWEDAYTNFHSSFRPILRATLPLWFLFVIGMIYLLFHARWKASRAFVIGFLLFSFLAVCPGLIFRHHYFVVFVPAASLLMGLGVECLFWVFSRSQFALMRKGVPLFTATIAVLGSFLSHRDVLFDFPPARVARIGFGGNPFPESPAVAEFVAQHTQKDDKIAIIGSEPQILFYSRRRSATAYIYVYALMEEQPFALSMQREMIEQIEDSAPMLILYAHVAPSWIRRPGSEPLIFDWFSRYGERYRMIALVEVARGNQPPLFHTGDTASKVAPESQYWISIHERK